jgi:hypothetical protein
VISVNGSFNRDFTKQTGKVKRSNISAVIPLKIDSCKNVTIENIEFNGNVDKMTRDTSIVEGGGYLVVINKSQNVNITNLFLHHAQTDGLLIWHDSKNIIGKGIVSSNNARQGMSIIDLTDGTFTDCKFINSGITEGKYGRHSPSAGIDIEPDYTYEHVNNIKFISCLFENKFVCSRPVTTQNIFFNNCTFNSAINSFRCSIIINVVNVVFEGCNFDCKNGSIYPVWHDDGVSSTFKKCNIKSNTSGFVAVNTFQKSSVLIDSCTLEYTGTEQVKSFFPYISMQNLSFTNNVIRVPLQYHKTSGETSLIKNAKKVSNNVFRNG